MVGLMPCVRSALPYPSLNFVLFMLMSSMVTARSPTVDDISINMNEDGMTFIDYSNPSYFYTQIPFNDVYTIKMPTPVNPDGLPKPYLVLSSLASLGRTYFVNGTEIKSVPTILDQDIKFQPDLNRYTPTSFTYYAVNPSTGAQSATKKASIKINLVNDPPRALPYSIDVYDRNRVSICMPGQDADSQIGGPNNVIVVTLPKNGTLNRTSDLYNLKVGDYFGTNTLCAFYKYKGKVAFNGINNYIGTDSFTFKIEDLTLLKSAPETASINVLMPYVSGAVKVNNKTKVHDINEDTNGLIRIYVQDFGTIQTEVSFVISAVPANGELIDPDTNQVLKVGDQVSRNSIPDHAEGVELIYRPPINYFNDPSDDFDGNVFDDADESFRYYAVSADDPNYRAIDTREEISILNINDPLVPTCPSEMFTVTHANMLATDNDFTKEVDDRVFLRGFDLLDVDEQVDKVRVTINSTYGSLSIVPKYTRGVTFDWNVCSQQWWGCLSTGVNEKQINFFATPENGLLAINGLRYQSTRANVIDTVHMYVFDGKSAASDSQCQKNFGKNPPDACFIYSCGVTVVVDPVLTNPPSPAPTVVPGSTAPLTSSLTPQPTPTSLVILGSTAPLTSAPTPQPAPTTPILPGSTSTSSPTSPAPTPQPTLTSPISSGSTNPSTSTPTPQPTPTSTIPSEPSNPIVPQEGPTNLSTPPPTAVSTTIESAPSILVVATPNDNANTGTIAPSTVPSSIKILPLVALPQLTEQSNAGSSEKKKSATFLPVFFGIGLVLVGMLIKLGIVLKATSAVASGGLSWPNIRKFRGQTSPNTAKSHDVPQAVDTSNMPRPGSLSPRAVPKPVGTK